MVATDGPSGGGGLSRLFRRYVHVGEGAVGLADRLGGIGLGLLACTCMCGGDEMVG